MSYSDDLREQAKQLHTASSQLLVGVDGAADQWTRTIEAVRSLGDVTEMRSALKSALEDLPPPNQYSKLVPAIVGFTTANMYKALADLTDYLVVSGAMKRASQKATERSEMQVQLNALAAQGKWDEWEKKLQEGLTKDDGPTGNGSGSP